MHFDFIFKSEKVDLPPKRGWAGGTRKLHNSLMGVKEALTRELYTWAHCLRINDLRFRVKK